MNPLKSLIRWRIGAFEREYGYDTGYMRQVLDADVQALLKFNRIMGFVEYHRDVPLEAWYAAKLAGTLAEDCGPCTQLVADMAERAGVSLEALRSILCRDPARMPDGVALAFRFAQATLAHDFAADGLRAEIVHRWGERALVSLAFAVTSARIFPTLKYALGHGHSCVRVRVGGVDMPVAVAAA